eukprot:TRINITY_DN7251_c0_g2_i1.p1 TRINITY_DN7251_c0_g2~~TRINITY_DN7251_c0_g2_i1.p1  ORF type:complete len:499 (-),score=107.56 TRINITY_DN7251_c0_g2_i1:43-1539(-)
MSRINAEVDDLSSEEDGMDPEMEALLYSQIHHQETHQDMSLNCSSDKECSNKGVDSGICSPKVLDSSSPSLIGEESRLMALSTKGGESLMKVEGGYSSSSDEEDNGIKVEYENLGTLKESILSQKKNLTAFVQDWEESSVSSGTSNEEESQCKDLKLNISTPKQSEFQSLEALLGGHTPNNKELASIPKSWNNQMNDFYNEINHDVKNQTLEEIFEELPDDPRLWKVNLEDRIDLNSASSRGRYYKKPVMMGVRCYNCSERGHHSRSCPLPRKKITCSMCGGEHKEHNCDGSLCLRCGRPHPSYTRSCKRCLRLDKCRCSECFCFGHEARNCPNAWRQFHLTTKEGELSKVRHFVPPEEKWCPNCGKKGHYQHQCNAYLVSPYPAFIGHVVNYTTRAMSSEGNPEETFKNLSRRERLKRLKSLGLKRKMFTKKSAVGPDINKKALDNLVSKAKQKKKRRGKNNNPINNPNPKRDLSDAPKKVRRKKSGKGKGKIKIYD